VVEVEELVVIELVVHFQFVEQLHIQLQLELVDQEVQNQQIMQLMEILQFFHQLLQ
jgi:hypothetical protein